ncbi:MAG: hypothetical protein ACKOEF_07615, partial [Acidimicrobiaceae bacterium]
IRGVDCDYLEFLFERVNDIYPSLMGLSEPMDQHGARATAELLTAKHWESSSGANLCGLPNATNFLFSLLPR